MHSPGCPWSPESNDTSFQAVSSLSLHRGQRLTNLSLERFRTSTKYQDRPAAADMAFCVAAYANGMTENRIERALEDDYLSRDPSTSKRAACIRNYGEGQEMGRAIIRNSSEPVRDFRPPAHASTRSDNVCYPSRNHLTTITIMVW